MNRQNAKDTLETPVVKKLMDVGTAAVNMRLLTEAEAIFDAVAAARPAAQFGAFGQALVKIARGNYDDAARMLRKIIEAEDEIRAEAEAMLVLALRLSGKESELEKVCLSAAGPFAKQVRDALQGVNR